MAVVGPLHITHVQNAGIAFGFFQSATSIVTALTVFALGWMVWFFARSGARDDAYDVPYTTLHVGRIGGGTALNIVPNACAIEFEFRNLAEDDPAALLACLEADAEAVAAPWRESFPEAAVRVEVVDDGPGMHEEVAERIFDPFFTTKAKGSGLGLGIVRKIVDAHDGEIDYMTAPGVGTTILVTLPIRAVDEGIEA